MLEIEAALVAVLMALLVTNSYTSYVTLIFQMFQLVPKIFLFVLVCRDVLALVVHY